MTEEAAAPEQNDAGAVAEMVGGQGTSEEPTWHYAEGVPGQGDKPEFLKDKYANITEQAKAYTELESRFGAFTGAPEKYEINISDQLKEGGIDIDDSDPIMSEAMEFANNANMGQEGFDKMIELYAMSKVAEGEALEAYKANELKALGSNGEVRIDNLNAWANANLPEDMIEGFQGMANSAASVQALEKLVSMTRNAPVNPEEGQAAGGVTEEEVNKLVFEKDQYGNRRMAIDPAFRRKVEAMQAKLYGSDDHRVVIGA